MIAPEMVTPEMRVSIPKKRVLPMMIKEGTLFMTHFETDTNSRNEVDTISQYSFPGLTLLKRARITGARARIIDIQDRFIFIERRMHR